MKHLTVEDIIDFVSFNELTAETLDLASKVNGHIRSCEECLKKVDAFQTVFDEFCKINSVAGFKEQIYRIISDEELQEISAEKVCELMATFDETEEVEM